MIRRERVDGLHPRSRSAKLADVTHGIESPQRFLPRRDRRNHRGGIIILRRAPKSANLIKRRRRVRAFQHRPKRAEITRAQPAFARHAGDVLCSRPQRCPLRQCRRKVTLNREASAGVRLGENALQIYLRSAVPVGVLRVKRADLRENFLRPIPAARPGKKLKSIGQKHRMARDGLTRIKVFGDERG